MKQGLPITREYDLTRVNLIRSMLRSRWPQFILRLMALAGFIFAILVGIFGTPVGSRNFAIIVIWIGWWALLILIAVPFFGRGWCSICPIPMPGEWLQQGALLDPQDASTGLSRRWPNKLRNIWLQNGAFILLALFSAVILTQPLISSLVLIGLLILAIAVSLIYERRAFCRYLCPVGGFIGLYSQLAPIELRVKDTHLCATHTEKTCYTGNSEGYGCPWGVFPAGLTKNTYCGTCMECLRTCPYDNITINLRSFGSDLKQVKGRKLDEALKAFIMLGAAMAYSVVMLGPWGVLKSAAYSVGSLDWLLYAIAFLSLILVILPGIFYLCVVFGQHLDNKRGIVQDGLISFSWQHNKKPFIAYAYTLVPLGLTAWVAFSLSFVLVNISYLLPTLSDPLGWGWDLFGTAQLAWNPYLTQLIPFLQVGILLLGLFWASRTARRTNIQLNATKHSWLKTDNQIPIHGAYPVVMFCLVATAALMFLLIA